MKRIRIIGLCLVAVALIWAQSAEGAPVGAFTEFLIPTAKSSSTSITAGPDGNLWFAEREASKIGRITPSGTISEFPLPPYANPNLGFTVVPSQPFGITAGPDGDLWFSDRGNGRIGRLTPTGAITMFPVPKLSPGDITAGPDGNLWFTTPAKIGRITPSGAISVFSLPKPRPGSRAIDPQGRPGEITAGPDGNLWFAEREASTIGRITASGTINEFPLPKRYGEPAAITAGPDGNLWFAEGFAIGRITPSGTIREFQLPPEHVAYGITAGPDGNLWFISEEKIHKVANNTASVKIVNNIGRITPSGTISEFVTGDPPAPPVLNSEPDSITAGPDGNIWFTKLFANKIGRIDPRLLPPPSVARCLVPKLKGKTLTQAKNLLGRAHCNLGKVTKPAKRTRKLVAVSQKPAAYNSLPNGAKVNVRLG